MLNITIIIMFVSPKEANVFGLVTVGLYRLVSIIVCDPSSIG